ncbi:lysylphosphatidylglycerol synthase transmembrane domain-containing protein [Parablautia muri]|uniref:lysylphosphatidylglycerol synthase transmembrane domain-containing protein n=1 Tax=Parablautia muri TaxID=2320879 RepID=UPI0013681D3F
MKKYLKLIIKIFFILVIIFILLRKVNTEEILSYLLNADKKMLLLAFVMVCFMCGLLAFKWKVLLKNIKFVRLLEGVLIGHIITYSLGGQIVGEGGKIVLLKKTEKNMGMITASILVDKITGFLGGFIVGLIGMIFSRIPLSNKYKLYYCFIIGGCICLIIGLFNQKSINFWGWFLDGIKRKKGILRKIGEMLENVLNGIKRYVNDKKAILVSILWGIILQIVSVAVSFSVCYSLDIIIPFQDLCWIMSLVSVMALVPLSVMGLGVSQMSTISLLMLLGVSKELAIGYSLVLYIIMISVAVLSIVLLPLFHFISEV